MILITLALVFLGLIFGSFVNALVWRVHENKPLFLDRSECPACGHKLAPLDLVPLLGWLILRGRCRYCRSPVSWQYPVMELAGAFVFAGSYLFWPGDLGMTGQVILLSTWLVSSIGLLALLVYDARWMLLPNKIIYPTLAAALVGRLSYILFYADNKTHNLWSLALSLLVSSGIFWLLFIVSRGHWIGYGDVRLGLITGTLLATPAKSFLMIFIASLLGILFALLIVSRKKMGLNSRIAFGPFLISATLISVLFGSPLINWYTRLFLPQ